MAKTTRMAMLLAVLQIYFTRKIEGSALLDVPQYGTCGDSATYNWMYNGMGQSPCELTTDLVGQCNVTQSWSQCALVYCCTVTYSLYSACLICNGQSTESWPTYYSNAGCSNSCEGLSGSGIPQWASLPLLNNQLNVKAAQQEAESTQTTGTATTTRKATTSSAAGATNTSGVTGATSNLPTGTETKRTTTATTTTSSPPQQTTAASRTNARSSKAAPIAGGVVGGLALIGVVIALLLYFMRRQRRRRVDAIINVPRPSRGYKHGKLDSVIETPTVEQARHTPNSSLAESPKYNMRLYDPNDPSTFPPPLSVIHGEHRISAAS
ncbi:hypothetical protein C8Q70DRAFT_479367 [Cubamyces menziesii]|nr:hypothetical protein C8Q70DRAFT_479367 [Cubamyces menziesii]